MSYIYNEVVSNGQSFIVSQGVSAEDTTIDYGGSQIVTGGTAVSALVYGTEELDAGYDSYSRVFAGGVEIVSAGGLSNYAAIDTGGAQYVYSGSAAYSAVVYGTEEVFDGGLDYNSRVYSGGVEIVTSGGIPNDDGGAISFNADIYAGGTGYTDAGGLDSSTHIGSGGVQYVSGSYSGTAFATIAAGGNQYIESGGQAWGANDGGYQAIEAGGNAQATYVSGGLQAVGAGGEADGATVTEGAQVVDGVADSTVLSGAAATSMSWDHRLTLLWKPGVRSMSSAAESPPRPASMAWDISMRTASIRRPISAAGASNTSPANPTMPQ